MNRFSLAAYVENERRRRRFRADPSGRYGYAALQHLSDNANGFVLDAINDLVLVKRSGFPEFLGTLAQALAAGILNYPSPSTKYVRNAAGVYVPGTTLRCQYSATGTPLGFLSEPQRQNLWLRSSDLSVSPWIWSSSGGGETVLSGDTSAYGDTLWTVMLGTSAADRRQPGVIAANTQTSVAFNVKRGNQPISSALYQVLGGAGTQTAYLSYNHDTDTVTAGVSGVSGIVLNGSGREIISDSEVRVWLVFTPSNGGTTGYLLLHRQFGVSFASTDTAQYGHVQVEYGAYPTSYIKTEASAVTRADDGIYANVSRMPSNSDQWSFICTYRQLFDTTSAVPIGLTNIASPSFNNTAYVIVNSTYRATLAIRNDGVGSASLLFGSPAYDARTRIAARMATDNYAASVDGSAVSVDTAGTFPAGMDRWYFGRAPWTPGNNTVRPIESIVIIPELLSNAELQARSAL